MATRSEAAALVIPEGAEFEANTQGWIITNQGDVQLLGATALSFHRVASKGGDVTLKATKALTLDRIEAPKGTVTLSGPITVHSIYGENVIFEAGELSVRSLVAESTIEIHGSQLQADMIVAPEVKLNKDIKGRATVIQSKNEIAANQLKGCFPMADYLEIFPNGQEQISQYPDVKDRMARWGGGASLGDSSIEVLGEPEDEPLVLTQPLAEGDGAIIEVLESDEDTTYEGLREHLDRILDAYAGGEHPPQVTRIQGLVESRDFDFLRGQINTLYSELIRHHKKSKLQIDPAVTAGIRDIRRLLTDEG